jgi:hypothetical protein
MGVEDLIDVDFRTVYVIEDSLGQFTMRSSEKSIWNAIDCE